MCGTLALIGIFGDKNAVILVKFLVAGVDLGPTRYRKLTMPFSEEVFRGLLNELPEAVYVLNASAKVVYANNSFVAQLGTSQKDIEGVSVSSFDSELADKKAWLSLLNELSSFETSVYRSLFLNQSEEKPFWAEVTAKAITVDNADYVLCTARDVSKQYEEEHRAKQDMAIFEQTSSLARVGGWILDLEKQKLYWTDVTREIHEVPHDYEPDFRTSINFYKEGASRDFVIADMTAAIEHGAPLGEIEVELVTAKGRTIWVRCTGEVVRENGRCVRVYGSIQDIDRQKRMEMKAERSYERLAELTKNVPGAVYQIEMDAERNLRYPFVSRGVREIFTILEFPGTNNLDSLLSKLINPEDLNKVKQAVVHSAETLEPLDIEFRHGEGAAAKYLHSVAKPERRNNGQVVWYGYVQNVSQKQRHREELMSFAKITAEQKARLRDFTHRVSHNIRSHVANLIGMTEIISSGDEEEQIEFMPLISESILSLDESIRNLNDIVNIQSQQSVTIESFGLHGLVDKTIHELQVQIRTGGVRVINNVPEGLLLSSNVAYMDSILTNLISNGVKYRSDKRVPVVTIAAELSNGEVIISVTDNGLGIDMDKYRNVVFKMYGGLNQNEGNKQGLGLFITKTQVEALGGKIEIDSEIDSGTTVRVVFDE